MTGQTFIIEYQTSNSARQVGVVNFCESRAQALALFADANGLKTKLDPLQPRAQIKGRTGTLYAILYTGGPLFFCKKVERKTRDFVIPVLIVGRTRGLEGLHGYTEEIMPLPASSDLLPKTIVCGPLYEPPENEVAGYTQRMIDAGPADGVGGMTEEMQLKVEGAFPHWAFVAITKEYWELYSKLTPEQQEEAHRLAEDLDAATYGLVHLLGGDSVRILHLAACRPLDAEGMTEIEIDATERFAGEEQS